MDLELAPPALDLGEAFHLYRPSEHTAALIDALMDRADWARGAHVAEIGSGSGVVLAVLARLGAASVFGVDVDPTATIIGRRILESAGRSPLANAEFRVGDVWEPLAGRRFDLVVCNPPQFPTEAAAFLGRPASWSFGGPDGRHVLDLFLEGVPDHLAQGGRAVLTHNAFIDLDRTRAMMTRHGLSVRILRTVMLALPPDKRAAMTLSVSRREEGRSLHSIGPYSFARMHVIEISADRAS